MKIQTPCGPLEVPIPNLPFPPALPSLSLFPLPFPPKLAFKLPDCDVVKNAEGAAQEPHSDSMP